MSNKAPTRMPGPGMEGAESEVLQGLSEPMDLSSIEMAALAESAQFTVPTLEPPGAEQQSISAAVWVNDKRIDAMWIIAENRNCWAHVVGVGWKRLAAGSDSAVVALGMLTAHARLYNRPVNYREEADGMIHEMYVG